MYATKCTVPQNWHHWEEVMFYMQDCEIILNSRTIHQMPVAKMLLPLWSGTYNQWWSYRPLDYWIFFFLDHSWRSHSLHNHLISAQSKDLNGRPTCFYVVFTNVLHHQPTTWFWYRVGCLLLLQTLLLQSKPHVLIFFFFFCLMSILV